jgi:hypothetical protein
LRQYNGDNIQNQVGDGICKSKLRHVKATVTFDEGVVILLEGRAINHVHSDEDNREAADGAAGTVACPREVASPLIDDENINPLEQDGGFNKGDQGEIENCCNPDNLMIAVSDTSQSGRLK